METAAKPPVSRDFRSENAGDGRLTSQGAGESEVSDPVNVARILVLRRLDTAARTRAELATYLRRKGVPDDAATIVLDRFEEVGLIDDAAFAEGWVRSRHGSRGLGRRAVAAELRRKGVASDVIDEALAPLDQQGERERATELARARFQLAAEEVRLRLAAPSQAQIDATKRSYDQFQGRAPGYDFARSYAVMLDMSGRKAEALRFLQVVMLALPPSESARWDDFRFITEIGRAHV